MPMHGARIMHHESAKEVDANVAIHALRYMNCGLCALQVFPDTLAGASRLYWNRLSLTARRAGALHCETEPLHDNRCTAS